MQSCEKIGPPTYGKPKRLAERFFAGEFGKEALVDVCARERLGYGSVHMALSKLRREKAEAKS